MPVPDRELLPRGARRLSPWSGHRAVLTVIAVGGILGAGCRYAADLIWPAPPDGVPWATLGVNIVGCLLIGVLMVFVVEVGGSHVLLRPFVGVGVLGGFTTFSTWAVEVVVLLDADRAAAALGYLLGTVLAALVAVAAGIWLGRGGVQARRRLRARRGGST